MRSRLTLNEEVGYSTAAVIKKATPLVDVITWFGLRAPRMYNNIILASTLALLLAYVRIIIIIIQ